MSGDDLDITLALIKFFGVKSIIYDILPSVPKIAVIVVKNAKETNSQNIVFKSKKQRLDVSVPYDELKLAEKEFEERGVAESEFQYEDCGYYEDEPTEEGLCDSS